MDDGNPALEVGFVIDTGGSFDELAQLQTAFDTTEARILREAANIERATSGMINLAGASATMSSFKEVTTSAFNAGEKAAERLTKRLTEQAATFGMTRAAAVAWRAEQVGATDAAKELQQAEAALNVLRAEAAAKVEAEAAAVREAAQAYQLFEARAKQAMAVYRDQQAAQAVVQKEREAQALREAAYAYQMFEAAARKGVAVMREQQAVEAAAAAETERFAVAAERLRQSIDPAYAAQQRFNGEMAQTKQLVAAGAITLDDYCAKLRVEQTILGQSTQAHKGLGTAQRFTASETLNLSRQFQDIGVTAAMGMNPLMILVQQGPQIYDVLEQAKTRGVGAGAALKQMGLDVVNYGVTGFSKLATFITPTTVLLAGTVVAAVAVVRALGTYGAAISRFEATATGSGRIAGQTAQQLETISEAAASAGQRSLSATQDSVNAFAAAGIQGSSTLTLLAANVEKYAKLTGQDVPAAQASLAEAMKDPARAADTFTTQLGLLTGAQYEHIKQLAAQGDQEKATAELTRILTGDLAANSTQATGLAHYMNLLGGAVSGVASVFGALDQRIKAAGASYDGWLKKNVGSWAVDLIGTGNQAAPAPSPNAGRNQDQVAALNAAQSLNTSGMKQFNDLLAQQSVLQKGLANTTGLTSVQVQALRHDYAAVTDTIAANRDASGQWITTQERAHLVAEAQAKLAAARTQTEKAGAQQQITRLQIGTQVLTQQERQTQALDAYNKVADKYAKPKVDHHADELAREAEATEAQTRNLYKLADAYSASSGSALIAEATLKGQSQAIKSQDDQTAATSRQISLAIAQRVADAAKATASMREQADVQDQVNVLVEAGVVSQKDASETLRDHMALLPLLQAQQAAEQRGNQNEIAQTTAAIDAMTAAQVRLRESQVGPKAAPLSIDIGPIKKFLDDYVDGLDEVRIHAAQVAAELESWDGIAGRAQQAAGGMADAWGNVGRAIGDSTALLITHAAEQKRQAADYAKQLDDPKLDPVSRAALEIENTRKSAAAQVQMYGDIAESAQGFFKKGSAGYKALGAAEKAYRAVELAMAIANAAKQIGLIGSRTAATVLGNAAMATSDTVATGIAVGNSALEATAAGAAGVAKQSGLPYPYNIAAMAATAAALVGFGITMLGGGGGTAKASASNQGTGTVFGDKDAQSESLAHSIDALKAVDTLTMRYSAGMLASLQAIQQSVGGLTNSVIAAGNIGSNLGVSESSGGLLGTKKKIVASGLFAGSTSLEDALAGSFDIDYFADVSKKKFLGSAKIKTTFADAGDQLSDQFSLILQGFYSTVEASATPLGQSLDQVHSRLANFVVDIGRIDTTGLSGEDIQKKLAAVFSAEGDKIAEAAEPGFEKFQKAGEGYLETLTRVVTSVESVTSALDLLGKSTQGVGVDASMALTSMFDSLSDFTDAADAYFDAYYTDAEKSAAKTAQLGQAFDMLGVAMPSSIAGFRALVDAQDLTTAAGEQTYATLLKLAPAFADLQGSAASASDILSERADLERQILEINGDTNAIRTLDLAKVNESNRALQEHAWALQDEKDAADAAAQAAQTLASQRDSLNRQLLTAEGDTAALRALDLAAMDASLRPIQEHINALQDQAAATQAATAAAEAAAQKEAAIAQERAGIQNEIWQAQGNTAAIRATELAALDPTDRVLKQQLYALQDQQAAAAAATQAAEAAAQAADQLRQAWTSISDDIMDEVARIRGLTTSSTDSYASLLSQFNAASALARSTDPGAQEAAKSLPGLSKALLDVAASVATSEQELTRIQSTTANSLQSTAAIINAGAFSANDNTGASASVNNQPWYDGSLADSTATAPSNGNDDLVTEVRELRADNAALREDMRTAMAQLTGQVKRGSDVLVNVSQAAGGDRLGVAGVDHDGNVYDLEKDAA